MKQKKWDTEGKALCRLQKSMAVLGTIENNKGDGRLFLEGTIMCVLT